MLWGSRQALQGAIYDEALSEICRHGIPGHGFRRYLERARGPPAGTIVFAREEYKCPNITG
jgi:hypothetical protein